MLHCDRRIPGKSPVINPKLLSDPEDMDTLLWALKKAMDIAEAPAFRAIGRGVNFPS
jgi:hypothetical protein